MSKPKDLDLSSFQQVKEVLEAIPEADKTFSADVKGCMKGISHVESEIEKLEAMPDKNFVFTDGIYKHSSVKQAIRDLKEVLQIIQTQQEMYALLRQGEQESTIVVDKINV